MKDKKDIMKESAFEDAFPRDLEALGGKIKGIVEDVIAQSKRGIRVRLARTAEKGGIVMFSYDITHQAGREKLFVYELEQGEYAVFLRYTDGNDVEQRGSDLREIVELLFRDWATKHGYHIFEETIGSMRRLEEEALPLSEIDAERMRRLAGLGDERANMELARGRRRGGGTRPPAQALAVEVLRKKIPGASVERDRDGYKVVADFPEAYMQVTVKSDSVILYVFDTYNGDDVFSHIIRNNGDLDSFLENIADITEDVVALASEKGSGGGSLGLTEEMFDVDEPDFPVDVTEMQRMAGLRRGSVEEELDRYRRSYRESKRSELFSDVDQEYFEDKGYKYFEEEGEAGYEKSFPNGAYASISWDPDEGLWITTGRLPNGIGVPMRLGRGDPANMLGELEAKLGVSQDVREGDGYSHLSRKTPEARRRARQEPKGDSYSSLSDEELMRLHYYGDKGAYREHLRRTSGEMRSSSADQLRHMHRHGHKAAGDELMRRRGDVSEAPRKQPRYLSPTNLREDGLGESSEDELERLQTLAYADPEDDDAWDAYDALRRRMGIPDIPNDGPEEVRSEALVAAVAEILPLTKRGMFIYAHEDTFGVDDEFNFYIDARYEDRLLWEAEVVVDSQVVYEENGEIFRESQIAPLIQKLKADVERYRETGGALENPDGAIMSRWNESRGSGGSFDMERLRRLSSVGDRGAEREVSVSARRAGSSRYAHTPEREPRSSWMDRAEIYNTISDVALESPDELPALAAKYLKGREREIVEKVAEYAKNSILLKQMGFPGHADSERRDVETLLDRLAVLMKVPARSRRNL